MEVLAAVGGTIVSCVCTDINTSIMDQCKYMKNSEEKIETLRSKRGDLIAQKDDVVTRLRAAEEQQGKKATNEVQNWFKKVQDIIHDVDGLEEEVKVEKRYLYGVLPNCRSRLNLGKQITKMIREVTEILEKGGQFSDVTLAFLVPEMGMKLPTPKIVRKSTAEKNLEMVWECLMDDEVGKIGVYGMGGIGKTTILKEINNRLLEEQHGFDKVIWVTVSKDANVRKLQDDIAKELDLDLVTEENEVRRLALLLRELEKRKKFVLILDDMWKAFSLHEIGIPEPTKQNGCKLAISTRSSEVCHMMECRVTIEVELLSMEEAWDLFMDKIGKPLTPEITEIAKVVVKECARLPLAIITTGGAMRGKDNIQEWRVALNDLRDFTDWVINMEDKVFKCLKLSYDRLGNEIIKKCFVCCGLYPEDWNMREEELIDYWIMEGLIEGRNRQDELDRGQIILNKLIYSCMLEKSKVQYNYYDKLHECVKMHDLLRDMAVRIATKNHHVMIKAGLRLEKLPDVDEWAECVERASLMQNCIIEISISPRCSRLSTLLLQGNPLRNITDHFFMHMQNLRILNLSESKIELLPNSVSDLVNLNALILYQCKKLERIPSLAKLQSLKVLDLNDTAIVELPQGMEALVNLKRLDLRHTKLREIPAGLVSMLSLLQELQLYYVDKISVPGGVMGIAFVEELLRLTHLENISISFRYLSEFTRYVGSANFKGLSNFAFDVVTVNLNHFFQPAKNRGVFICNDSHCIPDNALLLPQNTLYLYISVFDDLTRFSELVCLKDVRELRECQIGCCSKMKYIFSSEDDSKEESTLLQGLEVLRINDCPKLFTLYKGVATRGTLFFLKELHIWECSNLRYLFSSNLFKQLKNLEDVSAQRCDELEELLTSEEETGEGSITTSTSSGSINNTSTVPKLKKLNLSNLSKLKTLFPRLLQHFQNIEEVYVTSCEQMEDLIAQEERNQGSICSSNTTLITFPKLQKIYFRDLKLKNIWKGVTACSSLRYFCMWGCNEVTTLFPIRLMQNFGTLEEISVYSCRQLDELIAEDDMGQGSSDNTTSNTITLPRLRELRLCGLPKLKKIWKGVMVCDSLQTLEVYDCDELRRLPQFSGEHQSPPPSLKAIKGGRDWLDSLEWDHIYAKILLHPFYEANRGSSLMGNQVVMVEGRLPPSIAPWDNPFTSCYRFVAI